jgi:hypothetical protein
MLKPEATATSFNNVLILKNLNFHVYQKFLLFLLTRADTYVKVSALRDMTKASVIWNHWRFFVHISR